MNEKDTDESKEQQENNAINNMEQKCHAAIKANEKQAATERDQRKDKEKIIAQQRIQPVAEDIFTKILEKSIYEKARDKMKQQKTKAADDDVEESKKDYLLPILKKLSLEDKGELDEEAAIHVKNEALKNLKDRLLTRAEIIQRRLQEEQKALEQAYLLLKRKGETINAEDEQTYNRDMDKINFKIDILTERASQHYRTSLRKFEELDDKLMADPRLKVLRK